MCRRSQGGIWTRLTTCGTRRGAGHEPNPPGMALPVQTFSMGIVQRSSGPRGRSGVPIRAASAHHGSRVARPMLSTPRTKPPAPACPLWQKKKDGWAASPDAKTRRAPCDRIRGGRVTRRISPCPSRGAAVRNAPRRGRPQRTAACHMRRQAPTSSCRIKAPAAVSERRLVLAAASQNCSLPGGPACDRQPAAQRNPRHTATALASRGPPQRRSRMPVAAPAL